VSLHIERLVLEGLGVDRAQGEQLQEALSHALFREIDALVPLHGLRDARSRTVTTTGTNDALGATSSEPAGTRGFAANIAQRVVERLLSLPLGGNSVRSRPERSPRGGSLRAVPTGARR
jgi:hypothetical protein